MQCQLITKRHDTIAQETHLFKFSFKQNLKSILLFACWVFIMLLTLLPFVKINFSKNYFINTIRVSNGLDPDQERHSVGPDLGPNCLQRLSSKDKSPLSRKEFNITHVASLQGVCFIIAINCCASVKTWTFQSAGKALVTCLVSKVIVTHMSLASFLWDSKTRSDATKSCIWSGSPLFAYRSCFF